MSATGAIVDAQLQHLLDVVERRREGSCSAVLDEARQGARQIVRQAFSEARRRAHKDLFELREDIRRQRRSADARQHTRQRQQRQQADQELLDAAWAPLRDALLRRWHQPDTRQQWVNELINQASTALIDSHWLIEFPPDWPGHECNTLKAQLSEGYDCFPSFESQSTISAGLRICSGGACVDGTLDGLLHGRSRINALLLAEIGKQRRRQG